jgi:DNA-binding transcriptional LysR family regulator
MHDLEARQLGVRLLERTTRSVALTLAGAVLLEQARAAPEAVAAFVRAAVAVTADRPDRASALP